MPAGNGTVAGMAGGTAWRWLRNTALVAVAALGLDAAICSGLSRLPAVWSNLDPIYWRDLSPYHHELLPLLDRTIPWLGGPYRIVTNDWGFKDGAPRHLPARRVEGRRLLLMGDSFTEGIGVAWEQTFAGRLAGRLAPGTEVLNGAAFMYSPVIYDRKIADLLERGLEFDEVICFVDISDPVDEVVTYTLDAHGAVVTRTPPGLRQRLVVFLKDHFLSVRLAMTVKRLLWPEARRQGDRTGTAQTGLELSSWTFDTAGFERLGRPGLELASQAMERLRARLAERGIGLRIAVHPWPDQLAAGDLDSHQRRFWRRWAEEHNVGFIDLFPAFFAQGDGPETIARLYLPGDVHWNAHGHRLVSEQVLKALAP